MINKNVLNNDKGAGAVKAIFMIGLIVTALYVGYMFAIPYYKHNSMTSEATQIASCHFL